MTESEKLFKGQLEKEVVVSYFRRHWIAMLPNVLTFAFFLTLAGVFLINIPNLLNAGIDEFFFQELIVLLIGMVGYIVHRFFVRLIAHAMNIVIITNMRIIQVRKTLFRHNSQESIYIRNIQDIQKKQTGFFKNICGFGEIVITSSSADAVILRTVPSPDRYFRILNRVRDETFQTKKFEEREHQELHRFTTKVEDPIMQVTEPAPSETRAGNT